MKHRTRAGLAGAFALALALVVAPTPAQAAAGDGSCTYTESCVFRNNGYGGGMADVATTDGNWTNNYFANGGSINDQVSSGGNQDRAVQFFQHASYGGHSFILGIGQWDSAWSTNQPNASSKSFNFNDQVSSSAIFLPL